MNKRRFGITLMVLSVMVLLADTCVFFILLEEDAENTVSLISNPTAHQKKNTQAEEKKKKATTLPQNKKRRPPGVSLRGSRAIARQQNTQADKEKLTRIANEKQLQRFIKAGIVVPLPDNLFVRIDPRLAKQYRYCRPWTRDFLNDFGKAYYLANGRPIWVNSATRPETRQEELRKINGNAAPVNGPTRSSHSTASTVDIAKGDNAEWMRDYLWVKKAAGQIIPVEEFQQEVFHVMVPQHYGKPTVTVKAPAKVAKAKAKPTPKRKPAVKKKPAQRRR